MRPDQLAVVFAVAAPFANNVTFEVELEKMATRRDRRPYIASIDDI